MFDHSPRKWSRHIMPRSPFASTSFLSPNFIIHSWLVYCAHFSPFSNFISTLALWVHLLYTIIIFFFFAWLNNTNCHFSTFDCIVYTLFWIYGFRSVLQVYKFQLINEITIAASKLKLFLNYSAHSERYYKCDVGN